MYVELSDSCYPTIVFSRGYKKAREGSSSPSFWSTSVREIISAPCRTRVGSEIVCLLVPLIVISPFLFQTNVRGRPRYTSRWVR
jgi:hypothetical protein